MTPEVQSKLKELIAEIIEVEVEEIVPGKHFVRDLGADSMSALEMMATLEKQFEITIEPSDLPNMASLEQVIGLVTRLMDDHGKVGIDEAQ
ncbi:UNVERIFIED_CONTAM: hypothetical protein GTU68_059623 [Idotea baltica]|nr:hypothetical protein [Idotea baltica]